MFHIEIDKEDNLLFNYGNNTKVIFGEEENIGFIYYINNSFVKDYKFGSIKNGSFKGIRIYQSKK